MLRCRRRLFTHPSSTVSLVTLTLASALLACGGGGGGGKGGYGGGQTTNSTRHASSGSSTQGPVFFIDGGSDPVVSVSIIPPDAVLEVVDDKLPPPAQFQAKGKTQNGATLDLGGHGVWSYDRPDVANIDPGSGVFTPTGLVGGKGTITFKVQGQAAKTTATVKLHYTSDPNTTSAVVKAAFGAATQADTHLAVLYPYDKTVFPRGLVGPTIQWNGGAAGDVYYVHATSPTFEFESWSTVPPPSRFVLPTVPTPIWKKLTDSTSGDISVSIQRYDGTNAYLPATRTWTIAAANLTGVIYFWEVNSGNVLRLRPGDTAPEDFLQKPPGATCVACHSVSKNGGTLVASFNGSASPWGTFDSASGTSSFVYGTNPNDGPNGSGFQAITPDGSLVLWGQERGYPYLSLNAYNSATEIGKLTVSTGYPVMPAWAGDVTKVAFSVRSDGNWLDFNMASLWGADYDPTAKAFSNPHEIVDGTAARTATIYPTFSPDSKWIAFERSTQARSRGARGDIYLASVDGATVIPLDSTNASALLTGPEASSTYEPTFMPVAVGGYFWLVVVSERTYGNTLTDATVTTRRKQLWVTAIDATPQAGKDPSHPAFWLPGQALDNNNMRGEWALAPCKQIGESCSAGYDCCGGFCKADSDGGLLCSNQGGSCSLSGERCKTSSDCCNSSDSCIAGFCAGDVPH